MRSLVILLLAAAALIPAAAFADELYYIEVGGDVSQDDAAKQWQELAAKHKALLKDMTLYPKAIIKNGAPVAVRIQAGPLSDKGRAQKICRRLFAENTPCFVIEGLSAAPPSALASMSEQMKNPAPVMPMPWTVASESPPLAPSALEASSSPPSPVETPAAASETEPAQENNAEANVEVAEAIRVPLSEETMRPASTVVVQSLPEPAHKEHKKDVIGWLNVEPFLSADNALAFWQDVRHAMPEKAAGLGVHILRPLASREPLITRLNVGPFPSYEDATAFCRTAIQAVDKNLACRFEAGEPLPPIASTAAVAPVVHNSHGAAYETRRRLFAHNETPQAVPVSDEYWVQVISSTNEMDALKQWEEVKMANTDILDGLRSSVSSSLMDKHYVVRIGPLTGNQDADSLCAALENRDVACSVLLLPVH